MPIGLSLIQMFKKSGKFKKQNKKFGPNILQKDEEMKNKFLLPCWFKIIAYILSLMIIGVSIFFIIIKGINMGNDNVKKWVASVFISLASSILIIQPVQVFF